jgi:hypothetical protein
MLWGTAMGNIVVNEYFNSNTTATGGTKFNRREYIEFAITQPMSAAELAALTFGDSNSSTTTLQGVFKFDEATLTNVLLGANLTEFLTGTLIVVKGNNLGAQNLTYNPLSTNLANHDAWSLELLPGQGARDHSENLINSDINISNSRDVVWISTDNPPSNSSDTSGFIDAMGHGTGQGVIGQNVIAEFGANHILNSALNSNRAVSNIGDATVVLAQSNNATRATPNAGANAAWIASMRSSNFALVPEPGRSTLLFLGLSLLLLNRRRRNPLTFVSTPLEKP